MRGITLNSVRASCKVHCHWRLVDSQELERRSCGRKHDDSLKDGEMEDLHLDTALCFDMSDG